MNIIGIIPARMASTRFPNKPMAKIMGIPMIGHVYYRSAMCKLLNDVWVATCDREIFDYVKSFGGKAVMTADTHERASDRAAEAMTKIEQETGEKVDIVLMIQGDEPMLFPEMIDLAIKPMIDDKNIYIANLMGKIKTREEQDDPNTVKVVYDLQSFALYYSREPIPSWKKGAKSVPMMKQIPIIPFQRDFLLKFNQLTPTPLEIVESVDMMRVVEHGYKIKMIPAEFETYSVDTPADLQRVEEIMKNDRLIAKYQR
jgi:3-deoxy-manno-octulosonate cytidylyltransferase (CMP-KDO synthetase)